MILVTISKLLLSDLPTLIFVRNQHLYAEKRARDWLLNHVRWWLDVGLWAGWLFWVDNMFFWAKIKGAIARCVFLLHNPFLKEYAQVKLGWVENLPPKQFRRRKFKKKIFRKPAPNINGCFWLP